MIFVRDKKTTEDYEKDLKRYKGDCIFCDRFYLSKDIIEGFGFFFTIKNRYPYKGAKRHIVIISRRHFGCLSEMNKSEYEEMVYIMDKYNKEGLRILINGCANMTIPKHFHFQAITDK